MSEFDHSNDESAFAKWKRCEHISDNHICQPDVTMFNKSCQICGKKADWAMSFNHEIVRLYACTICALKGSLKRCDVDPTLLASIGVTT